MAGAVAMGACLAGQQPQRRCPPRGGTNLAGSPPTAPPRPHRPAQLSWSMRSGRRRGWRASQVRASPRRASSLRLLPRQARSHCDGTSHHPRNPSASAATSRCWAGVSRAISEASCPSSASSTVATRCIPPSSQLGDVGRPWMLGRFSTGRRQVLIAAVAPIRDAISCSSSCHPPAAPPCRVGLATGQIATGGGGPATGRVTVKVDPRLSSLSTRTVPPWASATWRTMARPRPVPPVWRALALSTR